MFVQAEMLLMIWANLGHLANKPLPEPNEQKCPNKEIQ